MGSLFSLMIPEYKWQHTGHKTRASCSGLYLCVGLLCTQQGWATSQKCCSSGLRLTSLILLTNDKTHLPQSWAGCSARGFQKFEIKWAPYLQCHRAVAINDTNLQLCCQTDDTYSWKKSYIFVSKSVGAEVYFNHTPHTQHSIGNFTLGWISDSFRS